MTGWVRLRRGRSYRYDQRGTGESRWRGRHTLARHVGQLGGEQG
ncbi:hypothetical protein AB0D38_13840 [Streptomyces sp. NPDC048279]